MTDLVAVADNMMISPTYHQEIRMNFIITSWRQTTFVRHTNLNMVDDVYLSNIFILTW